MTIRTHAAEFCAHPTAVFGGAGNDKEPKQKTPNDPDRDIEDELDQGLEDTFPASDPISVTQPTHTGSPNHKKKQ